MSCLVNQSIWSGTLLFTSITLSTYSFDQISTCMISIHSLTCLGISSNLIGSFSRNNYCATPTGEARFKIRSFIGERNGIPMGRLLCCTTSLASSWSLWDVQLTWCAVIGFNWKWRNTTPLRVFSAVSWTAQLISVYLTYFSVPDHY